MSREFLARSLLYWAWGPFLYHSFGLGCGGPSAGLGVDSLVASGVRADFFAVWRALPTFIFALLQAECAC